MKLKGPLVTLFVGLAVALVLLVLNMNATPDTSGGSKAAPAGNAVATTPTASTPSAPATVAPTTPAATKPVTYAGKVNGAAATIAIAINNGQVIAYLCNGRSLESWLQGTADGGRLDLTGTNEGTLTGTYGNGVAAGTVAAAGKTWAFRVAAVRPPSGLYRATATVRNAKVVGGWIVLANGENVSQTGGLTRNGATEGAPLADLNTLTTVVDGTTLNLSMVGR